MQQCQYTKSQSQTMNSRQSAITVVGNWTSCLPTLFLSLSPSLSAHWQGNIPLSFFFICSDDSQKRSLQSCTKPCPKKDTHLTSSLHVGMSGFLKWFRNAAAEKHDSDSYSSLNRAVSKIITYPLVVSIWNPSLLHNAIVQVIFPHPHTMKDTKALSNYLYYLH